MKITVCDKCRKALNETETAVAITKPVKVDLVHAGKTYYTSTAEHFELCEPCACDVVQFIKTAK